MLPTFSTFYKNLSANLSLFADSDFLLITLLTFLHDSVNNQYTVLSKLSVISRIIYCTFQFLLFVELRVFFFLDFSTPRHLAFLFRPLFEYFISISLLFFCLF